MDTLILLVVFFSTVMLVLGVYVFVNRRRLEATAALRDRLSGAEAAPVNILRDTRKSAVPVLDRALTTGTLSPGVERRLQRAGATWTAGEFVIACALSAVVGLLVGQQMAGNAAGFLGGVVGILLPFVVLKVMTARRFKKFEEQLPDAIDMIVNAMRAGFSFQTAMKFVGDEVPDPLGGEFMRFYDEQRLGADVRGALLDLQARIDTLDVKMFVTSLLIQRETGGNLSEVLGGLATLVRDRDALRGQIDALTAEPKFAGRLLALLPLIAFFVLSFMNPGMFSPMLESSSGRFMLLYAVASVGVGYYIMMKIADIDI
ncbi:MAG TPA: type II secretion system F family protein [Gemmatimonadaceae bacterium]|nr:type II secretion system F family protein [Gemmatimonadaceae bacterium]